MLLDSYPVLKRFFSSVLIDSDLERDPKTVKSYCETSGAEESARLKSDLRALLGLKELPIEEFGSEANRWFSDLAETKAWLESLLQAADAASLQEDAVRVLDSNGALLVEGDSVTVIKDLKVKGGSSDLKRGTLIRKIHLTADPALIECKVDGSVLVLRTEFLKKS